MNLTPAQAQPAPLTTTITRVGADLPPALALKNGEDRISDAPEVGAADLVTQPAASVDEVSGAQGRPQQEAVAERIVLGEGPDAPSAQERAQAAQEGYALSQEAYAIPQPPELQIGA